MLLDRFVQEPIFIIKIIAAVTLAVRQQLTSETENADYQTPTRSR